MGTERRAKGEEESSLPSPGKRVCLGPNGMRITVGFMGSAGGRLSKRAQRASREFGRAVAREGAILVTGACPGLPYDAVLGAGEEGGMNVGISPALSYAEHVRKYESPAEGFDVIIYTGSGLMGREVTSIRSCDVVAIAGGRTGTLGEFAIAYDEGKLIGVLTGTGGLADQAEVLLKIVHKRTGASVLYDDDPAKLVRRLIGTYLRVHYKSPSIWDGKMPAGG
ncbi:MAG: hypothetical protein V3V62_00660 [bacterium]